MKFVKRTFLIFSIICTSLSISIAQSGTLANGELSYEIIEDNLVLTVKHNVYLDSLKTFRNLGNMVMLYNLNLEKETGRTGFSSVFMKNGKFKINIPEHVKKFKTENWNFIIRMDTKTGTTIRYAPSGLVFDHLNDREVAAMDKLQISFSKHQLSKISQSHEQKKLALQTEKAEKKRIAEMETKQKKETEDREDNARRQRTFSSGETVYVCNRGNKCTAVLLLIADDKAKIELAEYCSPGGVYGSTFDIKLAGSKVWVDRARLYTKDENCQNQRSSW